MKHRTDPQKARKNDPLTVTLSPQATRLARAWHSEFARDAADIASAAVIDYLGETMAAIRKKDWNTAEESAFWIEEAIARAQLAREKRGARP